MSLLEAATSLGQGIGSLIGARKDKLAAENAANKSWQRNYDAQKEFAQNSIQWRVQDAKAAGINPYAAIGGNTPGYTPQDSSYQTSYQQGVSQAMNGLHEAMGQLQMASLQQDVEGKKLDNDKKALELINKRIEASLGQTSATLQNPLSKAHTNPVQGVNGMEVYTDANGHQWFGGKDLDDLGVNPQNWRKLLSALFSPAQYKDLEKLNGGGTQYLTWLGRGYAPEGTERPHRVNVEAARIADKYGTLAGLFSIPWNHFINAGSRLFTGKGYRFKSMKGGK